MKASSTEWFRNTFTISKSLRQVNPDRVQSLTVSFALSLCCIRSTLAEDVTPEILRCPLEQAVLRTKLLDLGEPAALLALVIDPPRLDNIARTIFTLKEIGALFLTANGKVTPLDGDLSYLGRVISRLPMDVHLGKLVMLGRYLYSLLLCLDSRTVG